MRMLLLIIHFMDRCHLLKMKFAKLIWIMLKKLLMPILNNMNNIELTQNVGRRKCVSTDSGI
ncbi:MAG: hypothetical protein K0R90_1613 [Oscillospiraceae bacterium]|jgi:hypothetical protein|nr:hypothetical protein [Oscillospiraceae bacterium]